MKKSVSYFSEEEIARYEKKMSKIEREQYEHKGAQSLPFKMDSAQEVEQQEKFGKLRTRLKPIEPGFPVPEHLEVKEKIIASDQKKA